MPHTIAMIQCSPQDTPGENLKKASAYVAEAAASGACMAVFPEYFMVSNLIPPADYAAAAQSLDGPFVNEMKNLAGQHGIWLLFGMNETAPHACGHKSYNTLALLDDRGTLRASYRKTHLFDAFTWRESDFTLAGDSLFAPVPTPFGKLGLGTCYDLRFPELARFAALGGAELMIYPSAWVKGDLKKEQWDCLLAARAVENGMFVLGVSQYTQDTCLGQSRAYDPLGRCLAAGGSCEEMLLVSIDPQESKKARETVPALSNRRTDLYAHNGAPSHGPE